jgi:hypothetical protein
VTARLRGRGPDARARGGYLITCGLFGLAAYGAYVLTRSIDLGILDYRPAALNACTTPARAAVSQREHGFDVAELTLDLGGWCRESNSSSGMSGAWNILKLKAVRPSGSGTARVGKMPSAAWSGAAVRPLRNCRLCFPRATGSSCAPRAPLRAASRALPAPLAARRWRRHACAPLAAQLRTSAARSGGRSWSQFGCRSCRQSSCWGTIDSASQTFT